jgi:hypothetical protein
MDPKVIPEHYRLLNSHDNKDATTMVSLGETQTPRTWSGASCGPKRQSLSPTTTFGVRFFCLLSLREFVDLFTFVHRFRLAAGEALGTQLLHRLEGQ